MNLSPSDEKEFKEKFGWAGSSGTFRGGIRDDGIVQWCADRIEAAEQRGRDEAIDFIEAHYVWDDKYLCAVLKSKKNHL